MGDAAISDLDIVAKDDSTQLAQARWEAILARYPGLEFVWLHFLLFEGSTRVRMIPVAAFTKLIESNRNTSLSSAYLHILRNDSVAKEAAPTGEMYLAPDLTTASVSLGGSLRVHILSNLVTEDRSPRPECLRSKLADLSQILKQRHGFYILVGYEIEVIFVDNDDKEAQMPLTDHKCAGFESGMRPIMPMVEAIVREMKQQDILLELFHPEMTPGQWEFVLPPQTPLEAVDTLIKARRIISTVSEDYGYRATLHPRPFPKHGGSGAHMHISVNQVSLSSNNSTDPFFAGIIEHFQSLMAFCLPIDISYERVAAGIWSGGEYVSWGWQNKETSLRRVANNRFEVKLHCGMANPYASLAATLAAGIDGLNKDLQLTAGDCQVSPSTMSEEQRAQLGIHPVPRNLEESIGHLIEDKALRQVLGDEYIAVYINTSMEWNRQLNEMDAGSRRRILLENY